MSLSFSLRPVQKEIRKQYKKLKSVVKLLEQAEKHVTKGYNHKAVDTLDEILAELRGMDVDSNVFRSTILLKLCRAQASMALHEQVPGGISPLSCSIPSRIPSHNPPYNNTTE